VGILRTPPKRKQRSRRCIAVVMQRQWAVLRNFVVCSGGLINSSTLT